MLLACSPNRQLHSFGDMDGRDCWGWKAFLEDISNRTGAVGKTV